MGTSTLFADLNAAAAQVGGGHFKPKVRVEFLTHPPCRTRPAGVSSLQYPFPFAPTQASWLSRFEVWFSILPVKALRGANCCSQQLIEQIDASILAYNENAAPFQWTTANFRAEIPLVSFRTYGSSYWLPFTFSSVTRISSGSGSGWSPV